MSNMRIPLAKRLIITFFNILFPPIAVGILTGWTSMDTLVNSCLFLLAVIPSHVHGFIISATYFHRKRKVRKGRFPGRKKHFVYSEKVQTGGAGWKEYERLKGEKKRRSRRSSKRLSSQPSSCLEDDYGKHFTAQEIVPPLPARPFRLGGSDEAGSTDAGIEHQDNLMTHRSRCGSRN